MKKDSLPLFIFLLFLSFQTFAQKEAAIWYFGDGAGLDFNTGSPVALTDGQLSTIEGCSTISDTNGSLLFYTDGITIWNRNHDIMVNGQGLLGDPSSTQSGLIVPHPGNPDIYFVFTADSAKQPNGINYSVIDMALQGGLGEVTRKNVLLLAPATEKITAVAHANGTDIWVSVHGAYDNLFHSYLISAAGVDPTPVTSSLGLDLDTKDRNTESQAIGYFKISPDGTRAIIAHTFLGAELVDFDSATGVFSNVITLWHNVRSRIYGVEFSPSSRLVYLNSSEGELYQYDAFADDVKGTEIQIGKERSAAGALQLAIDGKIYIAGNYRSSLSAIENPNDYGPAVNINYDAVDLKGRNGRLGLPPFIQSYFLFEEIDADSLCFGDTTEFSISSDRAINSVSWDFGDSNTSMSEDPRHLYSAPGTYIVSATVTRASRSKTVSKEITIYSRPVANAASDLEVCTTSPIYDFDLSIKDVEILGGQSPTDYEVDYYTTLSDARNSTNTLPKVYTGTNGLEIIIAKVTDSKNPSCFATTSLSLSVNNPPVIRAVAEWGVCDNDREGIDTFDLTEKDAEILNGRSAADFSVTYHGTQADADADTNAITGPVQNVTTSRDIFFRIENNAGNKCYGTGSFPLKIFDEPIAGVPSPIIVCDDNGSGTRTFDLSLKDPEVLNGSDPNTFAISYFSTENDAVNGTNPLVEQAYSNERIQETIFARIENRKSIGCFDTAQFDIYINSVPRPGLEERYVICPDGPELTIDGGNFESWSWTKGNGSPIQTGRYIDIVELGDYSLTVSQTRNGVSCERSVSFEVVSSGASEDFTTEIGELSDNVTITVTAIGTGDFEYSTDGENFQDSNVLEVFPGMHTVFVRDRLLCRTISKQVTALGYQKFFTPNGDGIHDNWNIIGAGLYPGSQLYIYDRYGKMLHHTSPMAAGWDGTLNGLPLPPSDYWFRYIFDGGKVFTGHFSLKR